MECLAGRYLLCERIGAGGMSDVWRGTDRLLGRTVAVKLVHRQASEVLHEARASARVDDAHVAAVYDTGTAEDGTPYLVMEFVRGPSLARRLAAGPLPWRQALDIGAQVAAGLAAVHEAGLVHRDVKPANVMLSPTGAKLVDFGISVPASTEQPIATDTIVGTPAYIAPERLTGAPARPPSDVYALGLTIYRALAGRLPWPDGTPTHVLRSHLLAEPAPLPHIRGLPDGVNRLIARCLAKDPARRPTAGQVAAALTALSPGSAGRGARIRSHLRPRRLAVVGAGIAAAATLLLTAAFTGDPAATTTATAALPRQGLNAQPLTCAVTYQVSEDDGHGFKGQLTVRNQGTADLASWTLVFTYPGDQRLVSAAPGTWSQAGREVTVRGATLAGAGQTTVRFSGTYQDSNALPANFSLAGATCDPRLIGPTGPSSATGPAPHGSPPSGPGAHGDANGGDGAGKAKGKDKNKGDNG